MSFLIIFDDSETRQTGAKWKRIVLFVCERLKNDDEVAASIGPITRSLFLVALPPQLMTLETQQVRRFSRLHLGLGSGGGGGGWGVSMTGGRFRVWVY